MESNESLNTGRKEGQMRALEQVDEILKTYKWNCNLVGGGATHRFR